MTAEYAPFEWTPDTEVDRHDYVLSMEAAAQVPPDVRDFLMEDHEKHIRYIVGLMAPTWREQRLPPEVVSMPLRDIDGFPELTEASCFYRDGERQVFYRGVVCTRSEWEKGELNS